MTQEDNLCPFCDSEDLKILGEDLFQCIDCGKIFDLLDYTPEPKHTKPKRTKWEDGDE